MAPLKETAAGEGVTLFGWEIRPNLAVFQNIVSVKPKVKPVKNSDWKEDSASYQEAPKALCKASEDMGKPSSAAKAKNDLSHQDSFTKIPSAFM